MISPYFTKYLNHWENQMHIAHFFSLTAQPIIQTSIMKAQNYGKGCMLVLSLWDGRLGGLAGGEGKWWASFASAEGFSAAH